MGLSRKSKKKGKKNGYYEFSKRGPDTSSIRDPKKSKKSKKSNQTKILTVKVCEVLQIYTFIGAPADLIQKILLIKKFKIYFFSTYVFWSKIMKKLFKGPIGS